MRWMGLDGGIKNMYSLHSALAVQHLADITTLQVRKTGTDFLEKS